MAPGALKINSVIHVIGSIRGNTWLHVPEFQIERCENDVWKHKSLQTISEGEPDQTLTTIEVQNDYIASSKVAEKM